MSANWLSQRTRPIAFVAVFVFQLWAAHALGYLVHEYAHSFVAWAVGCKDNPIALNYGHLSWRNVLTLDEIDENVDYDPLFAANGGPLAALIAAAGVLFGNGIFYLVSMRLYTKTKSQGRFMLSRFLFLFCLMNAGNLISYVPVRTFATHADMATEEQGLAISPWWITIVLGIPFCVAVWYFVARLLPEAMQFFFADSKAGQIALLVVAAFMIFGFFGGAGFSHYGEISHGVSAASVFGLMPLTVAVYWPRPTQN